MVFTPATLNAKFHRRLVEAVEKRHVKAVRVRCIALPSLLDVTVHFYVRVQGSPSLDHLRVCMHHMLQVATMDTTPRR